MSPSTVAEQPVDRPADADGQEDDTPPEEIVAAVRLVAQGRPVLSPEVTRRLIARVAVSDHDRRSERAMARLALLNDRERGIAVAVARAGRTPRSARCCTSRWPR